MLQIYQKQDFIFLLINAKKFINNLSQLKFNFKVWQKKIKFINELINNEAILIHTKELEFYEFFYFILQNLINILLSFKSN
jgi:hypothetical protein